MNAERRCKNTLKNVTYVYLYNVRDHSELSQIALRQLMFQNLKKAQTLMLLDVFILSFLKKFSPTTHCSKDCYQPSEYMDAYPEGHTHHCIHLLINIGPDSARRGLTAWGLAFFPQITRRDYQQLESNWFSRKY